MAADTNTDAPADGKEQPLHELKSQIKRATVAIEQAHKNLHENLSSEVSNTLINQVVQHSALLPAMLAQQLRMIEGLEHKFCDRFALNCHEEVEEIAKVAKLIQSALESAIANRDHADATDQAGFAELIFGSTARLNILQQRIAGKMMKVK